jgi:hypothetical protein
MRQTAVRFVLGCGAFVLALVLFAAFLCFVVPDQSDQSCAGSTITAELLHFEQSYSDKVPSEIDVMLNGEISTLSVSKTTIKPNDLANMAGEGRLICIKLTQTNTVEIVSSL